MPIANHGLENVERNVSLVVALVAGFTVYVEPRARLPSWWPSSLRAATRPPRGVKTEPAGPASTSSVPWASA